MTLNAVIAFILRLFTEFYRFSGRLYHSGWRWTYNVCKILSPSSSLLLLAKTITQFAARSLWASCYCLYVIEEQDSSEEVILSADTSQLSVIKSQTSTVRSVLQFTVIITYEYLIYLQKTWRIDTNTQN